MSQYPLQQKHIGFLDIIWEYKFALAFYIVCVSVATFTFLYLTGAVPDEFKVLNEKPEVAAAATTTTATTIPATQNQNLIETGGELPVRVVIRKIGVDTVVSNPKVTDDTVLNDYLLRGAVRYPGSGMLGKGNVFIFGHSTGLSIVNNQAFKTFNNLKNMNPQDEILVYSGTKIYTYKVVSTALVDSDQELVNFDTAKNTLTLSTCNVFGQKQERYVVQALFLKVANRTDL